MQKKPRLQSRLMQKRRTHDGHAVTNALCEQAISYRKDGCTCINPFDDGAKTRLNDKSLNHITLKERGSTPGPQRETARHSNPSDRARARPRAQTVLGSHVRHACAERLVRNCARDLARALESSLVVKRRPRLPGVAEALRSALKKNPEQAKEGLQNNQKTSGRRNAGERGCGDAASAVLQPTTPSVRLQASTCLPKRMRL